MAKLGVFAQAATSKCALRACRRSRIERCGIPVLTEEAHRPVEIENASNGKIGSGRSVLIRKKSRENGRVSTRRRAANDDFVRINRELARVIGNEPNGRLRVMDLRRKTRHRGVAILDHGNHDTSLGNPR